MHKLCIIYVSGQGIDIHEYGSLMSSSSYWRVTVIENRIYIKGEFRQSLGMNFFSPFQPFKVYNSCKCSQIICSRVQVEVHLQY